MAIRPRGTPAHLRPPWELSFLVPDRDLRFIGLALGPVPGLIGVAVQQLGRVVVTGKNRTWTIRQAIAFLRSVAPDFVGAIDVVLNRDAEPGPTTSGRGRRPERQTCQVHVAPNGNAAVTTGHSMRVLLRDEPSRADRHFRGAEPALR